MWSILFHYEGISVALGLAAMLLPVICLFRKRRSPWAALLSLSACTSAVLLQILGTYSEVRHGDFAAVEDTIGARLTLSVLLFLAVFLCNVVWLFISGRSAKGR